MSRRVPDDRLEIIHAQVQGEARRQYEVNPKRRAQGRDPSPAWMTVDALELGPLLDELKQRRRRAGTFGTKPLGATTRALMDLEVGQSVTFAPMTQGALTTARATARRNMDAPDARWKSETQADGRVVVTRLPDGAAYHYGKPRNPAVAQLASMKVGQTTTVTTVKGHLPAPIKQQARKAMDAENAQWKTERLANGHLRVHRVS